METTSFGALLRRYRVALRLTPDLSHRNAC
jgi:hypothetical protein